MVNVGDKVCMKVEFGDIRSLNGVDISIPQNGIVIYVNRKHRYYTVRFNNGLCECYKGE